MADFVEINMTDATMGVFKRALYDTPAEAVEAAELEGEDECSVYLFIDCDGDRYWGVNPGHDTWGVHATAKDAKDAEDWFEDEWCYTDDEALANKLNGVEEDEEE